MGPACPPPPPPPPPPPAPAPRPPAPAPAPAPAPRPPAPKPSDQRLKEKIVPLEGSLAKILQLQGVKYEWIDPKKYGNIPRIGFIAQEVEKIYPTLVETAPDSGMKSVHYDQLVAPLVEAIKELKKENTQLRKRLEILEKKESSQTIQR